MAHNLKDTYNKIAEDWHKQHQTDDWWVSGTDKFISLLKSASLVLDVGCAGGVKSRYLIDRGLRVTGIDISDGLVAIAKREVPKGEFLVLGMEELAKLEQQFDGIFMQASLLHIPRAQAGDVVAQAAKKLHTGGLLYIAVKEKRTGKPDEEVKKENDYGYEYERFFSYFTLDEIKGMMQAAGLKVVHEQVGPAGSTRWIQVIGQK